MAKKIIETDISTDFKESFNEYSVAFNTRMLFCNLDGMKPIHRRILFGTKGIAPSNGKTKKSARIIGDIIGRLSPHGDAATYEAMTKMVQKFNNNIPLIEGQGNFGSVDGSSPAAMRYCLTGESLLKDNEGRLYELGKLVDHTDNGECDIDLTIRSVFNSSNKADKFFDCGKHPVYNVTTKYGSEFTGTPNHPVLVLTSDLEFIWKEFDHLSTDDYIVFEYNNITNEFLNSLETSNTDINKAIFYGMMVSEGYISNSSQSYKRVGFSNTDMEFFNASVDAFKQVFPEYAKYQIRNGNSTNKALKEFTCYTSDFYDIIKDNIGKDSYDRHIPSEILCSNLKVQAVFLKYLYEGDGYVINDINANTREVSLSTYSSKLANQTKAMLLNFGILSSKQKRKSGEIKLITSDSKSINRFAELIGFSSSRKQQKLQEVVDTINSKKVSFSRNRRYHIPQIKEYVISKAPELSKILARYNISCLEGYEQNKDKVFSELSDSTKKQDIINTIENVLYSNILVEKVNTIKLLKDEQNVYSIRVNSDCHSFIANGFYQHNTEAKLSKIADWLFFDDLSNGAALMMPNYDNEDEEPVYLPSKIPMHLINGVSSGIGVGFRCGLPPHNPNEVINVLKEYLKNTIKEKANTHDVVLKHLKGPDFPTKGEVSSPDDIKKLYMYGNTSLSMRASVEIEEGSGKRKGDKLIFTGIPDITTTEQILDSIIVAVRPSKSKKMGKEVEVPPKIDGVKAVRDESSLDKKTGVTVPRIVVELKGDANADVTIRKLYNYTYLQKTVSYFVNCTDRYGRVIENNSYLDLLDAWYTDRIQQIRRRTSHHLNKVSDRLHTIEGLFVALNNIDKVIRIVRSSKDDAQAVEKLVTEFEGELFTRQAEDIIKMRIGRLTKMSGSKLKEEYAELEKKYVEYIEILKSKSTISEIILKEVEEFESMIGKTPRRTEVKFFERNIKDDDLDLVEQETVVVSLDEDGVLRRHPLDTFKVQKRGGKGKKIVPNLVKTIDATTHDSVMITTNAGNIVRTNTLAISEKPRGTHSRTLGVSSEDEQLPVTIATLRRDMEKDQSMFFYMVADTGKIKRLKAADTTSKMRDSLICFKSVSDESIVTSFYAKDDAKMFIASYDGKGLMLNCDSIRTSLRNSGGSPGMTISKDKFDDNAVACATVINDLENEFIFIITNDGFGKRIKASEFPSTKPGTKGRITQKLKENQIVVGGATVREEDIINIFTTQGKLISINAKDVRIVKRDTFGTRMIDLDEGDMISSLSISS